MQIVAVQSDIVWEDAAANHRRVRGLLESAKPERGAVVVLPEMFASGFSMDVAKTTDAGGKSAAFVAAMAKELGVYVVAGVVNPHERDRACHCNESVIVGPDGKDVARYQKIHPFTPGGESDHYRAGEMVIVVDISGWKVCPFVCYDLRFPEVFRIGVSKGAELFVVIANWPAARVHHWVTLLQARAIENQAYVVGVNRAGKDPKFEYPGRSLVVDPTGKVVGDAGEREGVIQARLDRELLERTRATLPFLKDMKPRFVRENL